MKRSNIITKNSKPQKSQELLKELLKKEHPKTSTKLPKFIKKKKKIITQQPKKTKILAPDRSLQLDIIKIHIHYKKCSSYNEIKPIYSRKSAL